VEKTSRHRSRDPVASGVKCGPHGGMNIKMKSWTVSWLSLKTKVESGLRGSRVMSGDWRRLHLSSRGFQWFTRKPLGSLVDPRSQDRRTEDGAAAAPDWSDRCATTQSGDFEAEDARRDRKACVEAKQVAIAGHPSDGAMTKISDFSLEGIVSLVV
jgi:hypothetical protein